MTALNWRVVPATIDAAVSSASSNLPGPRAVIVAVLLAAAVIGWSGYRLGRVNTAAVPDRVVAILEFEDLSQNPKDAWLSAALASMLSTELSITNEVRVLPAELVHDVSRDLNAGGHNRDTLAQLHRRLNADYVVSGHYRIRNAAPDPQLEVEIQLDAAAKTESLAAISKRVKLSALNGFVNQIGATLRGRLGLAAANTDDLSLLANAQPPTTAVSQRIGFALDAMQRHDAARARDELLEAVSEAPTYAPASLYLSRAWAALGYRQKALAAAQQAAAHTAAMPPELQLQIDAQVQAQGYELRQAVRTLRQLVQLKPRSIEYRLSLFDADIAVSDVSGAQSDLKEMRSLRLAAGDPRIELAAARLASAQDDIKSEAMFAAEALRQAQLRDAPGLIADALVKYAVAKERLGELDPAKATLTQAIAGYRQIGNSRGEVEARRILAAVLEDMSQADAARDEYQRAILLAQSIGDLGDVGAIYRNVASGLWVAGDRDGSEAAARKALQIGRQIGDLRLQAWTLRALALVASDDAATPDVVSSYRDVISLNERSNDAGGRVWSLAAYADLLRLRAQLAEAQSNCEIAQREAQNLSDPQFSIYSTFTCALIAVDRGDAATARTLLAQVGELAQASHNAVYSANVQLVLGQLDLEASRWTEARDLLRSAAQQFAATEARTGEADADALLALCAQELGDRPERDRTSTRARALRANITSRQEIFIVDIALAQLADTPHERNLALSHLRELAVDAQKRDWINWWLEAQLAEWRLLKSGGNDAAAKQLHDDLNSAARQSGFGRIVSLVNEPGHAAR